ncbi:MAG: hypothetical protein KAJ40_05935 [Alphaproteobacteria bacterium]|nr:hypothetical protein [Alphaproteobacteria bacterium]
MNDQDTTLLSELIASKICHDLTSPVGAVSNGVELLEEIGADDNIISLISFSTTQANAKLKILRMTYGLGGADESIKLEQIHQTFGEFIDGDKRVKQDWDPYMDIGFVPHRGFPKLLMCCLLLIVESLPKGGVISIKAEGDNSLLINAEGENAALRKNYLNTLERKVSVEDLNHKLIHPYIMNLFADKYGFKITLDESDNNFIRLRLKQSVVS